MGSAQLQTPQAALQTTSEIGYTKYPHTYTEVLPGKVSGFTEFLCVSFILRKTAGQERRRGTPAPKWAPIQTKLFARIAKCTERAATEALNLAVQFKLIDRRQSADDKRAWEYQCLPENWHRAPNRYKGDRDSSGGRIPKKPATSEESPEETAGEELEQGVPLAALRIVKPGEPLILLPGESSRPIPLPEAVRAIVVQNGTDAPLKIPLPGVNADVFSLFIRSHAEPNYQNSTSGSLASPKLKTTGTPLPVVSALFVDSKSDNRIEMLQEKLDPWFDLLYGKSLDRSFACQIVSRLGNASVESYLTLAGSELERWKRKPKKPGSGLFLSWADDANKAELKRRVRTHQENKDQAAAGRGARIIQLANSIRELKEPVLNPGELAADPSYLAYLRKTIEDAAPDELAEARRAESGKGPFR